MLSTKTMNKTGAAQTPTVSVQEGSSVSLAVPGSSPLATKRKGPKVSAAVSVRKRLPGWNAYKAKRDAALFEAIIHNEPEAIRTLVKSGADINARFYEYSNGSSLHVALETCNPDEDDACAVLGALLHNGADVSVHDSAGNTPLHLAAAKDNLEAVDMLLLSGAISSVCNHKGYTPIHLAAIGASGATVRLLLKRTSLHNFTKSIKAAMQAMRVHKSPSPLLLACIHKNLSAMASLAEYKMKNSKATWGDIVKFVTEAQPPIDGAAEFLKAVHKEIGEHEVRGSFRRKLSTMKPHSSASLTSAASGACAAVSEDEESQGDFGDTLTLPAHRAVHTLSKGSSFASFDRHLNQKGKREGGSAVQSTKGSSVQLVAADDSDSKASGIDFGLTQDGIVNAASLIPVETHADIRLKRRGSNIHWYNPRSVVVRRNEQGSLNLSLVGGKKPNDLTQVVIREGYPVEYESDFHLSSGDEVLTIDGEKVYHLPHHEIVDRLRQVKERVTLTVLPTCPAEQQLAEMFHSFSAQQNGYIRFNSNVPLTTRAIREDETDGVEFRFMPFPLFEHLRSEGMLLRWGTMLNYYYGSLKTDIAVVPRHTPADASCRFIETRVGHIAHASIQRNSSRVFGFLVDGGIDQDELPYISKVFGVRYRPDSESMIKVGDAIVAVNGKDTTMCTATELVAKLHAAGDAVKLTLISHTLELDAVPHFELAAYFRRQRDEFAMAETFVPPPVDSFHPSHPGSKRVSSANGQHTAIASATTTGDMTKSVASVNATTTARYTLQQQSSSYSFPSSDDEDDAIDDDDDLSYLDDEALVSKLLSSITLEKAEGEQAQASAKHRKSSPLAVNAVTADRRTSPTSQALLDTISDLETALGEVASNPGSTATSPITTRRGSTAANGATSAIGTVQKIDPLLEEALAAEDAEHLDSLPPTHQKEQKTSQLSSDGDSSSAGSSGLSSMDQKELSHLAATNASASESDYAVKQSEGSSSTLLLKNGDMDPPRSPKLQYLSKLLESSNSTASIWSDHDRSCYESESEASDAEDPYRGIFGVSDSILEESDQVQSQTQARAQTWDVTEGLEHLKAKLQAETIKSEYQSLAHVGVNHSVRISRLMRSKNRYGNIYAYDHTRVVLDEEEGDDGDYYNANFIADDARDDAYIACQGPTPNTMEDFWRMIYQQRVGMIVMVTNCVEGGKVKCHQYWPEGDEPLELGKFTIYPESEEKSRLLIKRVMTLEMFGQPDDVRTIVQFSYRAWPDHGVPREVKDLAVFRAFVDRERNTLEANGPVVVHCSAGVGRSGTFIALDRVLRRLQIEYAEEACAVTPPMVEVYAIVYALRDSRNYMVQTMGQYEFVVRCLIWMLEQQDEQKTPNLDEFLITQYLEASDSAC
eukprot:m.92230 g.92230  ORF g.92230 m.92230 type:complete len:1382 (+) comp12982_c0_seq1:361-4506(+)